MPMKPIRPRRNSVGTCIFYHHAAAGRGMQAARRSSTAPREQPVSSQSFREIPRAEGPLHRPPTPIVPPSRPASVNSLQVSPVRPLYRQLLVVHHVARVEFGSDQQAVQARGKIHFVVVLAEIEELFREAEKKNIAGSSLALHDSRLGGVLVFGLQRCELFEIVEHLLVVLRLGVGGAGISIGILAPPDRKS